MTTDKKTAFSLEFFPPRDIAAQERLVRAAKQMLAIDPKYVSVTFGAGGSTREGTADTVSTLANMGCDAAPHLSCVGATRAQLREILLAYKAQGVRRVVALRGDLPSGMGGGAGELRYAAELVQFIRAETGDWFHIEVAAYPETHPQAPSPGQDLLHFVDKVNAGADGEAGEGLGARELFGNAAQQLRLLGDPINACALHGGQCTSTKRASSTR